MSRLPAELHNAQQVRELDRRAIEDHGIDAYGLMQRAGAAAYATLREHWPWARRIVVLAGKGNNGGDGYVIARLAHDAGLDVRLVRVGDHSGLSGAAADAAGDCSKAGVPLDDFARSGLPGSDLCVDAMLGTGLDSPLRGEVAQAVRALAESGVPVFAVDVPTGLNADTGAVMGDCAAAEVTATFIGLKLGLFTGEGPAMAGKVCYHDLEVPAGVFDGIRSVGRRVTAADLARWLPPRSRSAHKGQFGHVLVLGGDTGMPGAVRMAGEAALRAGAGLVSIGTRQEHLAAVASSRPELMVRGLFDAADLRPILERATVLALGPGLGLGAWGKRVWLQAIRTERPLVLDADGLNWLARLPRQRRDWILTPHPGEAARLLETGPREIQADRPAAARELARRFEAVVVLKGAGSLVAAADGELALCDRGNPGMATGGMGDVLTGLVAGLLAQGLTPFEAARAGVRVHAEAADRAARQGERGLAATDLFGELRPLLNPGGSRD